MKMKSKRSLGWKYLLVQIVTISAIWYFCFIVGQGLGLVKKNVEQQDVIGIQCARAFRINFSL